MTVENFAALVIGGLVLGSLYALMASGLSLVWGTLSVFNFAHGAFIALGAYVAWTASSQAGLDGGLVAGLIAMVVALLVAGAIAQRLLIHPFRRDEVNLHFTAIVTTLAAATFITNGIQLLWGPRLKQLSTVAAGSVVVFGAAISNQNLVIIVLAPALLIVLAILLSRTMIGRAIRAVGQNRQSALLLGVNADVVYMTTFGIAAVLAGVAGILLGGIFFVQPSMGDTPLLRAFMVVVLGGLGSLSGTVVGAYILGVVESFSVFFVGLYWTPAVLFIFVIIVMMFRPSGLLGEKT